MALAGALVLLAGVVLVGSTVSPGALGGGQSGTPVATEWIDVTTRSVPIAVAGAFGSAGSPAGSDPLANSADGDRVVAAVLADLQDFWTDQPYFDGVRAPAGGYVSMDSTATSGRALCITDPAQIAGNAFYCPQGDGIVFDSSALVPVLLGSYGSAGLTAAFAHEFGHAIQAQIGPTPERASAGSGPLSLGADRGTGRLRRRGVPGLGDHR